MTMVIFVQWDIFPHGPSLNLSVCVSALHCQHPAGLVTAASKSLVSLVLSP